MIEFTDRYKVFGIPYPDPKTMCKGPCEGMGFFPQHKYVMDGYHHLWLEADRKARRTFKYWWYRFRGNKMETDYHFIKCPHCNGTGKEAGK